jgi:hypothetical protein
MLQHPFSAAVLVEQHQAELRRLAEQARLARRYQRPRRPWRRVARRQWRAARQLTPEQSSG